jgi:putative transposase
MLASVSELVSWLAGRFRSRAKLELEVIALRHQLAVLHRQRPGRPQLFALDRLLWIWLYRVWPRCLNIMVLVKPATVVQWHRQGFRLYWSWRSRSGRPSIDREVRDLIRQMNKANPLWGAPRIHGELLKLGIEVSEATVGKYMVRRIGTPSPTWRTFLRNEAIGIAAIDMFVAVSASFQLLYVMIVVTHSRREIVRFDVTRHPTAAWLSQQVIEAFPWDTAVASQNLIRASPFCGSATDDRNMHLRGQISQSLWRRRTLQTRIPRICGSLYFAEIRFGATTKMRPT